MHAFRLELIGYSAPEIMTSIRVSVGLKD